MEWTPLSWNDTPFWWNSSTKNFEVYSNLDFNTSMEPLNLRMYRVGGIWVLEQVKFGEITANFIVGEIPAFRGMDLLHCLAACCYLWNHPLELTSIVASEQPRLLEIIRSAIDHISLTPPEWLGSIESEFSS